MSRVTPALVRALVDDQFPQWRGLPLVPVVPGGWDNRSFRLGPELMVRVPARRAYAAQVAVEQEWLPRLASGLPLAIPEPVAMGRASAVLPWAWSVYRWLEGEPLDRVPEADLVALAGELGRFLARLHRAPTGGAPPAGAGSFHRGGDLAHYGPEVEVSLDRLAGAADVPAARQVWKRALTSRWERSPMWVHGDVAPGNLLLRGGRLAAVIDWGQACAGDPACDLAIAWATLDEPARAALREAMPLDDAAWHRGAGWALWKALIVAAEMPGTDPAQRPRARATLTALLGNGAGAATFDGRT